MSLTIEELRLKQKEFDLRHAGKEPFFQMITEDNLQVLEHLLVCLFGELGEFANVVKKVQRGDLSLAEAKGSLDEELVDAFIYLVKISNQLGVDLERGFLQKLAANEGRFEKYERS